MGCWPSTRKPKSDSEQTDNDIQDLKEVRDIPEVDSRLPLNMRQVFKLKQSWKGIDRNIELTGVEMFVR